jgi:hypothetical protein
MRFSIDENILKSIGLFLDRPAGAFVNIRPSEIMELMKKIQSDIRPIKEKPEKTEGCFFCKDKKIKGGKNV